MGRESLRAIGHAIREAGRIGMQLGLTTSSSWNAGGSWVTPENASMGLYKSEILGGQDWADLYQVDFDAGEANTFRRLDSFHAKCSSAPAFRWGGGATVVDDSSIIVYACERNVQNNNSRIRIDFFEA